MKSLITLLLTLSPLASFAGQMPTLKFKAVDCTLAVDNLIVKSVTGDLMSLVVDDHIGRFAQLQLGDDKNKIQYQILIEDDLKDKKSDKVIVLQNLMVNDLESSSEFSTSDLSWVRLRQGLYSVSCDVK
jgi:hypothetical protein